MSKTNPVPVWIRYLLPILLVSFLWFFIFLNSLFREPSGFGWHVIAWLIVTLYLIWGATDWINKKLDTKYPWSGKMNKRVTVQVIVVTLVGTVIFNLTFIGLNLFENVYFNQDNPLGWPHIAVVSVIAILVMSLINSFQIAFQLSFHWNTSKLEAEQFKRKSADAHLESLKGQIDPHFLFNNFSTLHGLIREDQERAGDYLLKLSDVYRQVLAMTEQQQVSLSQELKLLEPYTDLLHIRYGKNLRIEQQINSDPDEWLLPPMALQLLLENAIKHNTIEHDKPLSIHLEANPGQVTVVNNLQVRSSISNSVGMGLKNLSQRLAYLTGQELQIENGNGQFKVTVPLAKYESSGN